MPSSIYSGQVSHKRSQPIPHHFTYKLDLFYLDLDDIKNFPKRSLTFSLLGPSLFRFDRKDFYGNHEKDLRLSILNRVSELTGLEFLGNEKVKILTQCKVLGFCYNPVSFYYVFDSSGNKWLAVLAEINNTPWNQRHQYAFEVRQGKVDTTFLKNFHVSPFMSMKQIYRWMFSLPSGLLNIKMMNQDSKLGPCFVAQLNLVKKELNTINLWKSFFRVPMSTLKTLIAIYWNAAKLKLKGNPYYKPPFSNLEQSGKSDVA